MALKLVFAVVRTVLIKIRQPAARSPCRLLRFDRNGEDLTATRANLGTPELAHRIQDLGRLAVQVT